MLDMLLWFSVLVALLYDTVLSDVCCHTYNTSPGEIIAASNPRNKDCHDKYSYIIRADGNYNIVLNFTLIHGFKPRQKFSGNAKEDTSSDSCWSKLEIREIQADGKEFIMEVICNDVKTPKVFQTKTNLLKLTYMWTPGHRSRFKAEYTFKKDCPLYKCNGDKCVLVCNTALSDCSADSASKICPSMGTSVTGNHGASHKGSGDLTKNVTIVITVVLILVVVVCVVFHYRFTCWWNSHHRRHPLHDTNSNNQLQPQTPSVPERVYVPTCHPDRFTHESQPGYTDMMLGYPPTIQISLDGEEGYKRSQLLLHKTMDPSGEIARASIRPPPNKTIYDGDSPPPSRSQSVGLLNRHSGKPPSTRNLRQCGARSTERIGGCYSPGISNNNNYPSNSEFVSSRTCSSAGHSRNSSGSSGCSNTEAPPPYSDVIANIDDFTCRSGNV
ncbi:uncharacterized protein LOC141901840 [Tubulanus polymorphus]|uniref:uncharacterized protein LOC141901840 n=1 Tax=Tubulanus polymorphus TaxID=672921 RepID=UPI003DA639E6